MAKRALVTGGAGFLGSHLSDRLLARGWSVVALDDLSSGRKQNIEHLENNPQFRFVEHDVQQPFDGFEADAVFNLACPASPPVYQRDPIRTTLVSVLGTFHALSFAKRCGARFLQASTSEVYGDPKEHPQTESYRGWVNTLGPRACYDEGKRCAESIVMDFRRVHGLDTRIARIFNTYGPRMDPYDGRVVSNFVRQALAGEALTIYGDGSQTRSFCYVDDLITGLVALMEYSGPSAADPVNIGNPTEFTVRQLAQEIVGMVNKDLQIRYEPLPVDDPLQRCPDISRAESLLGFKPAIELRDGLARTIEYFRR